MKTNKNAPEKLKSTFEDVMDALNSHAAKSKSIRTTMKEHLFYRGYRVRGHLSFSSGNNFMSKVVFRFPLQLQDQLIFY